MAWTGIKVIHDDMRRSTDYVQDPEKTMLENSVDYAFNRDKTETTLFESAIGCINETAYQEMLTVKRRFRKEGGVQGYHLVQSFQTDEVTPEQCHALGLELARRLLPEGYQVIVCSHLNTDQYHNHLVWNSVNGITGKKYHIGEKDLYLSIRRISDELCREHGLSVIEPKPGSRGKHYAEIMAERTGKPTQRQLLKEAIDKGIAGKAVFSPQAMLDYLSDCGYEVNANPRHKYVTVRAPGAEHAIRLGEKLGEGYSWEDICWRIAEKRIPSRANYARDRLEEAVPEGYTPSPRRAQGYKYRRGILHKTSLRAAFSLRGLRALYFDYLYRMGYRPGNRRWEPEESAALKTDVEKLNKRIRMMGYLARTGYESVKQLHARIFELEEQTKPLIAERKKLYRKPDGQVRIDEINEQLRPVWAEIFLCRDIEKHSVDIHKTRDDIRAAQRSRQSAIIDISDKQKQAHIK